MENKRLIRNILRYKGKKTITRTLLNTRVESLRLDGLTLDLGSGRPEPSFTYYEHITGLDKDNLVTVNLVKEVKPHVLANLEVGLPFGDGSVKNVLMFNKLSNGWDILKKKRNMISKKPKRKPMHIRPSGVSALTITSVFQSMHYTAHVLVQGMIIWLFLREAGFQEVLFLKWNFF